MEWIRTYCLSLPHVTENVQWGDDLVFKIGGKMFAVTPLIPHPVKLSFKATPESFHELIERDGIIPAPYMARAQWVALERLDSIPRPELKNLLATSYDLVLKKLPKKTQAELKPPIQASARRSRS
jgi:predicted DNA-binding protein (MmcQ/YjbR family)